LEPSKTFFLAAERHELGAAGESLDELRRQLSTCRRLLPRGVACQHGGDRWNDQSSNQQAGREHERRRR
jgi:hypothetical protein